VAAIITALHDRIQQRTSTNSNDVSFANEEFQDLQDALHEMELTRVISAHLPLKNNGILGRFVTMPENHSPRIALVHQSHRRTTKHVQ
jgi:hypothetical protein